VCASAYAGPSDDATPDRLLIDRDVAEILNVPVTWVQQAGLDGRLPSRKIGLYRRYVRAEILDWLSSQSEGRR
jgi:predicted DNA-binding transcriptional regulator AlpA